MGDGKTKGIRLIPDWQVYEKLFYATEVKPHVPRLWAEKLKRDRDEAFAKRAELRMSLMPDDPEYPHESDFKAPENDPPAPIDFRNQLCRQFLAEAPEAHKLMVREEMERRKQAADDDGQKIEDYSNEEELERTKRLKGYMR